MNEENPSLKPFPVSWEELHRHSKALAWRLSEKGPWEGIIAVTRGGLVPAAVIARELELRCVESICVSSYDHQKQRAVELVKPPMERVGKGKGWIVVDDLADTGRTLELIKKMLPEAHRACVYAKPAGKPLVDSFVIEVSQDTWIYFPWDVELQFVQPIATRKKE
ncbi:MAG TPA: xanthine phosphoribosyltransferase [Alphaproteobacteria bacterium]|nr:xanthine phosphoribosyltransferase [Alphaproteobacteria bacterium]